MDENLFLSLPKDHHHKQRRFWLAMLVGGSVVLGVWVFQMKVTFDKYAQQHEPTNLQATLEQVNQQIIQPAVADGSDKVDTLTSLVEAAIKREQAKDQVLTEVGAQMKGHLDASVTADPAVGVVAGEHSEAP